MTDELDRERAAHRETAALLEQERTARADDRETVLAMMQAANAHMDELRAAIEALTKRVEELERK